MLMKNALKLLLIFLCLSILISWRIITSHSHQHDYGHQHFRQVEEVSGGRGSAASEQFHTMSFDWRKTAYVTLLTSDSTGYVESAMVLASSIERTLPREAPRRDRVALVTSSVSAAARRRLARFYSHIVEVPVIVNPQLQHIRERKDASRFENVYVKLNVWNLTNYERVVFLDADTLLLRPIEKLFSVQFDDTKFIAAASDCCDKFNSGVMVLRPSSDTLQRMLSSIASIRSYDDGDQGFLNLFFSRWHRLPYEYNAQIPDYLDLPSNFDINSVRVVHYELLKPWEVAADVGSKEWQALRVPLQWWLDEQQRMKAKEAEIEGVVKEFGKRIGHASVINLIESN